MNIFFQIYDCTAYWKRSNKILDKSNVFFVDLTCLTASPLGGTLTWDQETQRKELSGEISFGSPLWQTFSGPLHTVALGSLWQPLPATQNWMVR